MADDIDDIKVIGIVPDDDGEPPAKDPPGSEHLCCVLRKTEWIVFPYSPNRSFHVGKNAMRAPFVTVWHGVRLFTAHARKS